jgi:putative copper resistance protein D
MKQYPSLPNVLLFPLFSLAIALNPQPASSQDMSDHSHMHQQSAQAESPRKSPEELEADKRFSEFNHRFAGVFLLLIGLLAVFEPRLAERFGWVRYLWSFLFFAPGVYLLIWSDPESWPVGDQTLTYVITQNLQVLQHKIFSLILLGLGVVEFIRVRSTTPSIWLSSVFPVLAGFGAILLFFHPHASDVGMAMDAESHAAMMNIQRQHVGFALAGFGIAISKAISDVGRFHPRLMHNLFAVFMVILAMLLITYTE